jgi:hypothetical protein
MSIGEILTQKLAEGVSRRSFIKGIGISIVALGIAMLGQPVTETKAEQWCCTGTPECADCRGGGSVCPIGYHQESHYHCCLNYCQYMCLKCHRDYPPYDFCWCYHDDMVSCGGRICGSK